MLPFRHRILAVLTLLVVAPVCAEYLQAYVPETGDAVALLGGLLVLGPLYGGAALLIRETAVRTHRGWPGVLLMAAAFGLLMTAVVDGSLWLAHDPSIAYWDELRAGTLLGGAGFAVYPLLSWVTGHVVFSIGAPLALLDALAPAHRGRPLLGRTGLLVVGVLCVGAALLIRADYTASDPSSAQTGLSLLAVAALLGLALSPAGRPLAGARRTTHPWPPVRLALVAAALLAVLDLVPPTWAGAAAYVVVLALGGGWLVRAARSTGWGPAQVTALGVAAVLERTLLGFVAPLPPGVDATSKIVESIVLLVLAGSVSALAWQRGVRGRQGRDLTDRGLRGPWRRTSPTAP